MVDSESSRDVISVSVADVCTEELVAAVESLLPQLSEGAQGADLEHVIASDTTHLFVARLDGRIIGMLTLAAFVIPTGIRAWIEDVVVDHAARGRGVGELLTLEAIALARSLGAETVELTSRPSREAANRLYRRLGFEQRETNVYRLSLAKT